MSYYSVADRLSEKISPIIRKLGDLNIKRLLGTQTELLRLVRTEPDEIGQYNEQLEATVIKEALVKRPYSSRVRMFQSNNETDNSVEITGMDIWDILPIEIRVPFNGDYETEQVSMKIGDLLVEILRDENNNKMPYIMQVTKINGAFHAKNIIGRYYEACLYRGPLPLDGQQKLDEYIATVDDLNK